MRILAIETATEACSIALFDQGQLIDARHEVLGRGHAERLVPMIAELPEKGHAEQIRISLGPGSFTGVRIGLAVARALGVAWKIPVRGYPTLALVAAMARAGTDRAVTICMSGGHGEWFVQDFGTDGMPLDDVASLSPDTAAMRRTQDILAGTRAEDLSAMIGVASAPIILPNASYALLVPDALLRDQLSPLYGRAPDAKLPM
ncbi:MAG TPA: tRNA (adenosine(37)-N6)-threonylcarbamoyltransferase complex dimerization subunit type 1 TsaB [Erythrobacter sp.]|nr:tRNA (adenosine(37)-N6)-threonylcarbamoyltransferase complex dimerization subunit type 1 TsaB [Sphingomonadaceae bacterium]HCB77320.1 tRNA (adenosine(37)-N6)-threonylcarbamoyltransferase complex dimerization subunit type 1 TsaB [Erythrobacter sp.]|tara:strand:- start:1282 stop:1890 length:609 start_codon:yes stop_codon:yes gene_type:complete